MNGSESDGDAAVLPPKIAGKYRPIRHIATGGMGAVYEVEHEATGERLALKILKGAHVATDPTTVQRFRREARVHAALKSEHVVRVIDAGVAPELGVPFLVMDLLEGENLADVAGDEPQPASRVVGWLHEIAAPLDAAHAAGIIHRDLKPENLFLTRRLDGSPIVKILDFGIAKIRGDGDADRTGTGAVIGTPLYMAPEQAAAEHDRIGPGTDMWSLAMIAFRLLTGRAYWSTHNVSLLLAELVSKKLKPPSSRAPRLDPAFDAWFLQSCHRDPLQRFASVGQQVAALAAALDVGRPEARGSRRPLAPTLPDGSGSRRTARAAPVQSLSGSVASAPAVVRRQSRWAVATSVALVALAVTLAAVFALRDAIPPTEAQQTIAKDPAGEAEPVPLPSVTTAAPPSQVRGLPSVQPPAAIDSVAQMPDASTRDEKVTDHRHSKPPQPARTRTRNRLPTAPPSAAPPPTPTPQNTAGAVPDPLADPK